MPVHLEINPKEAQQDLKPFGSVLIVNQNDGRARMLREYLRHKADSIDLATTGEEALELISEGRKFTLVLTSLELPGKKQGWSVMEAFAREQPKSVRVLWTDHTPDITRLYSKDELIKMGVSEVVDPFFGFGATRDSLLSIMQERQISPRK